MLTHIDSKNNPTMVDVSGKETTVRMAEAVSSIILPEEMRSYFSGEEIIVKKGPVFHTAIIAGTMAVKKTHETIPFCHQIPVESCKFDIKIEDLVVSIKCRVKTTFKTGVEMEALHGVTVAALTVYDMCKAVSHDIRITETKLASKTGGKRTVLERPLYGLVLTGGKSERMKEPKALINYKGKPHAQYIYDVLSSYCDEVFLSQRENQWKGTALESYPSIEDTFEGPMGGMLSAFTKYPEADWIVAACDLVHFNEKIVEKLLAHSGEAPAVCFKNRERGFPEPLCAYYTSHAKDIFMDAYKSDVRCPVKVLRNIKVKLLDQEEGINLANINTPEERHELY